MRKHVRLFLARVRRRSAALAPAGQNLILGACKFRQEPVGVNVLRDPEQKAERVPREKPRRQLWYVLFSAGGFTDERHQLAAVRSDVLLADEH